MNHLHIVFSSDDNYARHLGVAMHSVLINNQDYDIVTIHIIDNAISDDNKAKLKEVADEFSNAELDWIDFGKWERQLKLDMAWDISVSSYARLFVSSMLAETVDRVIYMDCDMLVFGSMKALWETQLNGKILGAVQDAMRPTLKEAVGVRADQPYFNAGLLLIDLTQWRHQEIEKKCVQFIADHNGRVMHHDQGVLNGVLKNNWYRLPLKFNLMTIHYIFDLKKIGKYFKDESDFYNEEEITKAKNSPVILHFTPSFTVRPWVKGCKHPKNSLYWNELNQTPWMNTPAELDQRKWYVKLIDWRYRLLPF